MARRHYRHHRRGSVQARKWVNLAGKIIGASIVAYPALTAISQRLDSPSEIPQQVLYNYSGFSMNDGTFNAGVLATGVGSIAGGLILMKVFSYIAKKF